MSRVPARPFRVLIGLNDRVPHADMMERGILRYATEVGWKWLMDRQFGYTPLVRLRPLADGIIAVLFPGHGQMAHTLGIPVVSVHDSEPPRGVGQVRLDSEAGIRDLITALDAGSDRLVFLFVNRDPHMIWERRLAERIRSECEFRGCWGGEFEGGPRTRRDGWSLAAQLEDLGDWLDILPARSILLATDEEHGKRLVMAADLKGHPVPDRFHVACVGNNREECVSVEPALTCLEFDLEKLGYEAAALLDRMRRGETPGRVTIREGKVMLRASSTDWPTRHPALRVALQIMKTHVAASLSVEDVARMAGMNRTTLFQLFRRELGTTPLRKMREYRMELARELLREGDLPLKALPERCGFLHLSHFCREFKRATGLTPTEFRKTFRS